MREKADTKRSLRVPLLIVAMSFAIIGVASGARADQTHLYEWRDASGAIAYSQIPPGPGTPGVLVREFDTRTLTPAQELAAKSYLHGLDAAALAGAKRFRQQVEGADHKVNKAVQRLANAEKAMRSGRAPVAGERLGNAGGGSRLRAEYFERQRQLETAIQTARAELKQSYTLRDEIHP